MGQNVVRITSPGDEALALMTREYPGYHPLVAIARLAHRADVIQDPRLELDCHKAILPYVRPKLSNVEVDLKPNEERRVVVSLFEERTLPDGRRTEVEIPLVTEVQDVVPLDV